MIERFVYRIKQFVFSIAAQMGNEDRNFARQHLDIKESALFFALPVFEQKHAVIVAQKMMDKAKNSKGLDQRKLARLGLLHDIGKGAVRLSIFDKSLLVVLHRFIKPLYDYFAHLGEPENSISIFRKFYVHKHHGTIGSKLLSRIGESRDIVEEVAQHEEPLYSHDIYVQVLDAADSTY